MGSRLPAGRHGVRPERSRPGPGLRVIEGRPEPDDVPADEIELPGFRVTDPTGAEQTERKAALQSARTSIGKPRPFQYRNGRMVEVSLDDR